ncbi:MAG: hypothetical protein PHP37_03370 [Patescibacteria group bacterium]|nr:hypothetical protein [Patescibacteria group bacterium]
MKKNFYFQSFLILLIVFFFSVFSLTGVLAGNLGDAFSSGGNSSLDVMASEGGYSTDRSSSSPESVIAMVIQALLSIVGVVFIIIIIYGGIIWMTAGGNEEKIDKAKDLVKRAVIGLIIVVSAYAISIFVVNVFIDQVPGV